MLAYLGPSGKEVKGVSVYVCMYANYYTMHTIM